VSVLNRLYYDETSKSGLRWAVEVRAGKDGRVLLHSVGDEAGSLDTYGYYRGKCGDENWKAHRVVWELHNGTIPRGASIDHINGIRYDNRLANLRLATPKINAQNASKTPRNKSGITGVTQTYQINRFGKKYDYWSAYWVENGKLKHKAFSFIRYGEQEAKRLATEYRKARIEQLNAAGANYTGRHGK